MCPTSSAWRLIILSLLPSNSIDSTIYDEQVVCYSVIFHCQHVNSTILILFIVQAEIKTMQCYAILLAVVVQTEMMYSSLVILQVEYIWLCCFRAYQLMRNVYCLWKVYTQLNNVAMDTGST